MRKTYHFTGFFQNMPNSSYDIDTEIEAYSSNQAYYLLSRKISKTVRIQSNQLYSMLKKSKSVKVSIKN